MSMTPHPARYVGVCRCGGAIMRGDTVYTYHAGWRRRTLCRSCGRRWLARQAHDEETTRQAHAAALRAPTD